jgi:hypothetical protein
LGRFSKKIPKNVKKRRKNVDISATVDRGENFILFICHFFGVFHLVLQGRGDPTVKTPEVLPVGISGDTAII